jgi:hypothetical protein
MRTITIIPSTAEAVVMVMVRVAAELLVTFVTRDVIGTVAALAVAVTALGVATIWLKVWVPVKVWAASVRAMVALVVGKVWGSRVGTG